MSSVVDVNWAKYGDDQPFARPLTSGAKLTVDNKEIVIENGYFNRIKNIYQRMLLTTVAILLFVGVLVSQDPSSRTYFARRTSR